jgi:two-component system CheB/CheR fusion protein
MRRMSRFESRDASAASGKSDARAFFRDPLAWEYVAESLVPAILAQRGKGEVIRVWSAGCGSGEEVYTLAILLCEALGVEAFRHRVRILATDRDAGALAWARRGVYARHALEPVGSEHWRRYFEDRGEYRSFRADLRAGIEFRLHELVDVAPIRDAHLITCRNTLLYSGPGARARILARLYHALAETGVLLLGSGEVLAQESLFAALDARHGAYAKAPTVGLLDRVWLLGGMSHPGSTGSLDVDPNELASLLDALPALVAFVDRDERFVSFNSGFESWLGAPRQQVEGRAVREVAGARNYETVKPHIDAALSGRISNFEATVQVGGEERKVHSIHVPHFDRDGAVTGYYAILEDTTQRIRADESAMAHHVLHSQDWRLQTVSGLADVIAHEISRPLGAIVGFAGGAIRRIDSGAADFREMREVLGEIRMQAERTADVVRCLNGLIRVEPPNRKWTRVDDLKRRAARLIEVEARRERVAVRLDPDPEAASIHVDPVQIEMLLVNLARNGIAAMRDESPEDRELVFGSRRQGDAALLSVRDAGEGVPEEIAGHLFEPFVSGRGDGLGLGLAISRRIAQANSGRLWFTPNEGRGTTFHLELPAGAEGALDGH